MSIEFGDLSPIERELHFSLVCKKEGIERLFFDLDGTICDTPRVIRMMEARVYDLLAENAPVLSREGWKGEVVTANDRLFETLAVNPIRWSCVVDELADKFGLDERISREAKRIFGLIYTTPIPMMEGAEEGLAFIKKSGLPMGIVTHADRSWTLMKYNWLNLRRFVDWDDVFVVDQDHHKTWMSWREAVGYFRLRAIQCAVVGDSPRSDINPAWEAGVRHCFLVESPSLWSVHDQPVDPSVYKISHLGQIAEAVLARKS